MDRLSQQKVRSVYDDSMERECYPNSNTQDKLNNLVGEWVNHARHFPPLDYKRWNIKAFSKILNLMEERNSELSSTIGIDQDTEKDPSAL